jgi:hypothetical protein
MDHALSRYAVLQLVLLSTILCLGLGILVAPGWYLALLVLAPLSFIGIHDLLQTSHAILRNYPVIGHMRFLLESIRPELRQ